VYSCIMFRHLSELVGIPLLFLILIHLIRISYDIRLAAECYKSGIRARLRPVEARLRPVEPRLRPVEPRWSAHVDPPSKFRVLLSPMKNMVIIDHEYQKCLLLFDDKIRFANLLPLDMSDFDISLGMNWLADHRAPIVCHTKRVIFGIICVEDETRFFELKREWGRKGCERKKQGDGGTHSLGNSGAQSDMGAARISNTVDDEDITPSVVDMTVEMGKQNSLDDTTVPESFPPLSTPVTTTAANAPGKSSYANITGKPSRKKVSVLTLFTPGGNGIDVVVPVDSIRAISERFVNTAYGSSTGLFSFQFSFIDGLDAMLENGPWFIQNNPLILKKWHLYENLLKEDVSTVPVWVKLHGVLVTAFSEDGLSVIATKLGTPLMLDSYTSNMCMQSWGKSSYARVMIELRAD
nr:hypothetical protein [Tanacetum cinerariifolium]